MFGESSPSRALPMKRIGGVAFTMEGDTEVHTMVGMRSILCRVFSWITCVYNQLSPQPRYGWVWGLLGKYF